MAAKRAKVVTVSWYGTDTVRVLYRTDDGVDERLLSRADEERLWPARLWPAPQERTRKTQGPGTREPYPTCSRESRSNPFAQGHEIPCPRPTTQEGRPVSAECGFLLQ